MVDSQHDFVPGGQWNDCIFRGRTPGGGFIDIACGLSEDSPFHAGPDGHTVEAVVAYEARKAARIAAFVQGGDVR